MHHLTRQLILLILLLGSTTLAQTPKALYPRVGPAPDVSRSAQERYEARKARYDQLIERMDREALTLDDLSHAEQRLLGAEADLMPESIYDFSVIGCSWYCGGGPYEIVASSQLPASGALTYGPENAHDFKLNTAWVEGVPGHGVGEYIEYRFRGQSPPVTTVLIYSGYGKSERLYQANSRPRELRLLVNGVPYAMLNLADSRGEQTFDLGEELFSAVKGQDLRLRFEVVSAYPGNTYEDLCITDITFDGTGVHCFAAGTPITLADGTQRPIEALQAGDQVLSYDPLWGTTFPARVEALAQQHHHHLVALTLADGRTLRLTRDHPLLGIGGQWLAVDPQGAQHYVAQAQPLVVGSTLACADGPCQVMRIEPLAACVPTYTITQLSRGHLFQANGVWSATESLQPVELGEKRLPVD